MVSGVKVNPPPRSVNVALETSFLFEPKDVNENISFIQNIKVFLDKLYKILAPQAQEIQQFRASNNNKNERSISFTDFIKKLGESFLNFNGLKAKDTVKVLKSEVSKIYNQTHSTINEVIPDFGVKQYIKDTIKKWATEDVPTLKDKLKKIINDNNPLLTTFARRLNDYYTEDDIKKLNKLLKKLNHHLENDMDTSKIVRDAIDIGIHEKFKKLNTTSKISLMNDMKLLSDFISQTKPKDNTKVILKRANDMFSDEKDLPGSGNDSLDRDEIYNELKRTIGKKLRLANERMRANEKRGVNANEIVVDNMELLVQSHKKPDDE